MIDILQYIYSSPQLAASNEKKNTIKEAMVELPEEYRMFLQLYFFEGICSKAIAEQMNCSVATVNRKIKQGMYYLKLELNPEAFNKAKEIQAELVSRLL